MTELRDAAVAYRQRRWMRPDAHRFIRHDAWRFMAPGSPRYVGRDVVKYFELGAPGDPAAPRDKAHDRAAVRAEIDALLKLKSELAGIRAELKFRRFLRAFKAGFNPDQPRDDLGQWTEGGERADEDSQDVQIAGTVIRICIAGSRALTTDSLGNKSHSVEYQCFGGRSFTRSGSGHNFRASLLTRSHEDAEKLDFTTAE